jgi:hypothetical protein
MTAKHAKLCCEPWIGGGTKVSTFC